MIQRAVVISLEGDMAQIDVYRSSACGESCGGNCAICKTASTIRSQAVNEAGAAQGDLVEVETESGKVLGLAFISYILPIITAIAFYYAGAALWGENGGALTALAGLLVGFLPAAAANRSIGKNDRMRYRIVKIIK